VLDLGGETLDTTTQAGKVEARMLGAFRNQGKLLRSPPLGRSDCRAKPAETTT
jgi:hypothetical protein